MATRGIASSPPSISSFSPSRNSFSIKSILNLSDETVGKQEWVSKDAAPIGALDTPCPTPSLLVAPRAVFPPGYHCLHFSSCLPTFGSLPSPQPVVQITPFIFPNHVASFGKLKKISRHVNSNCIISLCSLSEVFHCVNYSVKIATRYNPLYHRCGRGRFRTSPS